MGGGNWLIGKEERGKRITILGHKAFGQWAFGQWACGRVCSPLRWKITVSTVESQSLDRHVAGRTAPPPPFPLSVAVALPRGELPRSWAGARADLLPPTAHTRTTTPARGWA